MIYTVDTDKKIITVPVNATLTEIVQALDGTEFAFEDYEILREPSSYSYDKFCSCTDESDSKNEETPPSSKGLIDYLRNNTSAEGVGIGVRVTSEQPEKIMEALKNS